MSIVDRVKNILLSPKTEWPVIAGEATTTQSLYTGYIMILAAIGPVAMLLRSVGLGITGALVAYIVALAATYIMALIVDALAPTFGGEKNFMQSLKLTAYSYTADMAGRHPASAGRAWRRAEPAGRASTRCTRSTWACR